MFADTGCRCYLLVWSRWRSEEVERLSLSSSWELEVLEEGGPWLTLALELVVVPRYLSRGAPCWTAARVLEVTSD